MDAATAIQELEKEWDEIEAQGFFGQLRYGKVFNEAGYQRVMNILASVEVPQGETLDKRFIEVTWFIPAFMFWQREGWVLDGINVERLDQAISTVIEALTRVLGLP